MNPSEQLRSGKLDHAMVTLYGADALEQQKARYAEAIESFTKTFGERKTLLLFSAPGRTELGGNHTDHNHGRVLAAAVNLDVIAVVAPSDSGRIRMQSAGYPLDEIALAKLSVQAADRNRSAALIRGTAARFAERGYAIGGFDAYTTSDVLKGSGLSSSAAFEVLVGTILNHLYNKASVSAVEIAQIAQYAENVHFGKPSGLMDQMASSVGGIVAIDFANPEEPVIDRIPFDFDTCGFGLCIVDTGGNHADLTHEYAAVPAEMKAVAASLGVSFLRETTREALLAHIGDLRRQHGDRAVLRALHFFNENERVAEEVAALSNGSFSRFLELVLASGHSSFEYLQNVYANADAACQGLSLALCMAEMQLDRQGAWRVHGGGFGGTTQNFVPLTQLEKFRRNMEAVFGLGACHVLRIRPCGGVCLNAMPI